MTTQKTEQTNSGGFWKWVPLLLLGTSLSGWFVMVRLAVDDPGFAVEADYYKKASEWDRRAEQEAKNLELGWKTELEIEALPSGQPGFALRVLDAGQRAVTGARVSGEAFENARAADLRALEFTEREPGLYVSAIERARPGIWEVRLSVERGAEKFTSVLRPELIPLDRAEKDAL